MKTNTRHLFVAAGILLIAGGAIMALKRSPQAAAAASPVANSTASAQPVSSLPSAESSSSPALRRDAAVPNKSSASAVPMGISASAWQKASAIVGVIGVLGDGSAIAGDKVMESKQTAALLQALGLAPDANRVVSDLISARNDAMKDAAREAMQKLTSNSSTLTEMLALSAMADDAPLDESQQARLDELSKQTEDLLKGDESKLVPWYEDSSFLDTVRGQLTPEQSTLLDDYAGQQKSLAADKQAFNSSQELAEKLGLSGDQRDSLYTVYREDPEANDDKILPLLNDSQKAAYQAEKEKKPSAMISIFGGN